MANLKGYEWIDQNHPELQRRYPNMYIAVKGGRVLAADREFGKVYDIAVKQVASDFITDYVLSGEPFVFKADVPHH